MSLKIGNWKSWICLFAVVFLFDDLRAQNCQDSDGGRVLEQSGRVSFFAGFERCAQKSEDAAACSVVAIVESDICLDQETLLENFCEQDQLKEERVTCPSGSSCRDGACRPL